MLIALCLHGDAFKLLYGAYIHYVKTLIHHVYIFFSFHSLISNDCHSLLRVARDPNIFFQIMVTF